MIIGGGPAGTAGARILAEHGQRVLVLEREKFPRYHIGESLLPFTFHPLQRLGLIRKDAPVGVRQKIQRSICFAQRARPRSHFISSIATTRTRSPRPGRCCAPSSIMMLMDNARAKGAEVLEANHRQRNFREERPSGRRARGA